MKHPLLILILAFLLSCNSVVKENDSATNEFSVNMDSTSEAYFEIIKQRNSDYAQKNTDTIGELVSTFKYLVRTNNIKDFENGYIPWISIEHPENEINELIDKDNRVISENKITIIFDYPLTHAKRLTLFSKSGFTRRQIVEAISKEYHRIYIEEEATAKIKTIPPDKRTTMYNRNETDGKYGIWGHDLADLVLAEILIYKAKNDEVIISLNIES